MSSLPAYSMMGSNMAALERVESTPATLSPNFSTQRLPNAGHIPVYPYPVQNPYIVPGNAAFGFSSPYSPYYPGATLSPGLPENTPLMNVNVDNNYTASHGPYGLHMMPNLPTLPPRYSMSGTPFTPPNRGCISPLDLFGSPSGGYLQGIAPGQGAFGSGSLSGSHRSGLSGSHSAFSTNTSLMGTPALTSGGFGMAGLGLGVSGDADTPVDGESAPDTNIASPTSSAEEISNDKDDDEEHMDENDEDEDGLTNTHSHHQSNPRGRGHDTIKLKIHRSPMTDKALALDPGLGSGDAAPPVKKRSRTAQACERCRIRKARCFGGNPCNRCVKRKFECEFTPSRTRPVLKPEPKPKARRHSMHVTAGSSSSSMTTHAPLGRMHSHNNSIDIKSHARSATHPSASNSVYQTVTPNNLAAPYARPQRVTANGSTTAYPSRYGMMQSPYGVPIQPHANTHNLGHASLPTVSVSDTTANTEALPSPASNLMGTLGLPMPYSQAPMASYDPSPTSGGALSLQIPTSGNMPSTAGSSFPSSLGLNLGPRAMVGDTAVSAPTSGTNALGLGFGLGVDLSPTTDGSSPDSDLPSMTMSNSYTSSEAGMGMSMLSAMTPWSGMMDSAPLPTVQDEMFEFSPDMYGTDSVQVVAWDEPPSPAAADLSSSLYTTSQEHLESVRDAATRQLFAAGAGDWYGHTSY